MRISLFPRLLLAIPLLAASLVTAPAQEVPGAGAKILPEQLGGFRAAGRPAASQSPVTTASAEFRPEDFAVTATVRRNYLRPDGQTFFVSALRTASASAAYSLLTHLARGENAAPVGVIDGLGVLGISGPDRLRFIKGDTFVDVRGGGDQQATTPEDLRAFAKTLAERLGGEAGEVPILVLHLPEGAKAEESVGYAVSLPALRLAAGDRPALDAVSFEGGAEAVTARYGAAQVVIVEFTTPQYATDSDARVAERIAQLRAEGGPVPSGYRRVGNYAVFVFDAPEGASAEGLLAGVKYEKDVRWLGRNPHADEILANAERRYTQKMGGVILTTLKTTGLAILLCLGIGGLFGGAVFMYRRAQTGAKEAYSDAGGMMRLNLEDVNAPGNPSRLIGRGEK